LTGFGFLVLTIFFCLFVELCLGALFFSKNNHNFYRFVTPQNILCTDFVLQKFVLTGFTFATTVESATGDVGATNYTAPEVSDGKSYDGKADIYSFGATLWNLLTDSYLSLLQLKHGAAWIDAVKDELKFSNEKLVKAVVACIDDDPAKRPTAEELFAILA